MKATLAAAKTNPEKNQRLSYKGVERQSTLGTSLLRSHWELRFFSFFKTAIGVPQNFSCALILVFARLKNKKSVENPTETLATQASRRLEIRSLLGK